MRFDMDLEIIIPIHVAVTEGNFEITSLPTQREMRSIIVRQCGSEIDWSRDLRKGAYDRP